MPKKITRLLATLLTIVLLVSSVFPQFGYISAYAETEDYGRSTVEKEKEREQYFAELEEEESSSLSESGELASLLTGLGFEPKIEANDEVTPPPYRKNPKERVEKEIYQKLEEEESVDVIIKLKDQENMEQLFQKSKQIQNREERIRTVMDRLQKKADASQKELQKVLESLESKGNVEVKQRLWINNSIVATVDQEALEEIEKRDDVKEIVLDRVLTLPEITVEESVPNLPEWGLEKIQATKVWGEYGIKGEGIVVGIMDTGVDGNHEALKHNYRGRDGNHKYSWIDLSGDGYETPSDGHGHGTHVAGSAVGGGSGEPIGVAPEAEWIAAKIFNDNGRTTTSAIHAAFEWFLAPGGDASKAPHIVNNSWGNSNAYTTEYYEDVQAWIAAGIFPMFAGGNDGPASGTIGAPGSYVDAFTIGATDRYDYAASFSSRGPVYWPDENGNTKAYIKPDLSAPGHQIYSAYPESLGKGKYAVLSGTSMATPHATGAVALLLSANPDLKINDIKDLLINTARVEPHMGEVPNNTYGAGILNIYQAVTEAAFSGTLTGTVKDQEGNPLKATITVNDDQVVIDTDNNGNFNKKVREGTYEVSVSAFGYKTLTTTISVNKNQIAEYHWQLEPSNKFTVSGQIVLKDSSEGVPFVFVQLKNTPLSAVRSDENGRFILEEVPEGSYDLQISGSGIQGITQKIDVNQDLDLTIEATPSTNQGNTLWKTANNNYQRNSVSGNAISQEHLQLDWEYQTGTKGEIVFSTPAANEKQIVFTTDRGWIISLDAETGEEIWSVQFSQLNRSSPTIEGNRVYVGGGENGVLYALNLDSGQIIWQKQLGQPTIYTSPIYKEGVLYAGSGVSSNPKLYALDAENGSEIWSVELGGSSFSDATLGDEFIYIGTYENRTVRAINPEDGSVVWSQTIEREGFASRLVYDEGIVYAHTSNFDTGAGSLYAFDGKTGEILWQIDDIGNGEMSSPIVYENIIIASSRTKPLLRAFNKTNGEEIWTNQYVGTALNNGSISANGILFFASTSSYLYAIDVYTGEVVNQFMTTNYSTSGIPILPGRVIVPTITGVQSYIAAGALEGKLVDQDGNPLNGTVTVIETGKSVSTNENGEFLLSHFPGTFTVKIASYGFKQIEESVTFVSGFTQRNEYVLEIGETGSLTITTKDKRTTEKLPGVKITIENTPITGTTDGNGEFTIDDIVEGTYILETDIEGYATEKHEITIIANEENAFEIPLQPYDIAVLNDWNGEITKLLNNNGFFAIEKDWDIIDNIDRYEIVYLNGAYTSGGWKPDEEILNSLINAAKNADVDLVFVDVWGPNYGSIKQLVDYFNDPKSLDDYSGMGSVYATVQADHPIFDGYQVGDHLLLTRTADFAWFNGYSGMELAKIGSERTGIVGSGVAYKPVSEGSAHVLLSSHGAASWNLPSRDWTQDMTTILLNSMRYLQEAVFGTVSVKVNNSVGEAISATIEVVDNGMTIESNGHTEFYLEPGEYTIRILAPGYHSVEQSVTVEHGEPTELNVTLQSSEGSSLTGSIIDEITNQPVADAEVTLQQDGETVAQATTSNNGSFTITNLDDGNYLLNVEKDGYIRLEKSIHIGPGANVEELTMVPTPRIGVLEDYSSNNFAKVFEEIGVAVTNISANEVVQRMDEFDVIFVNQIPTSLRNADRLNELLSAADEAETSLIFGDDYYTSSPIYQLQQLRQDPEVRDRVNDQSATAGYYVEEEHPIFADAKEGDFVDIRPPTRSRLAYFDQYSGYTIAKIGHNGQEPYGIGIGYKPRTAGSVELLMSGHGFSIGYNSTHYTDSGKELLVNAVIWAAYTEFPTISGTVTDQDGNPLLAEIQVVGENFAGSTNPETGEFSIAIEEGTYEIEVSSFGYVTQTLPVTVTKNSEPLNIVMKVDEETGAIHGRVESDLDGFAVEGVEVEVNGFPRTATTNLQGSFTLERLLPGTYTLVLKKEGYVEKYEDVEVKPGEITEVTILMKPSPKVGVIRDYNQQGQTLKEYLTTKGYLAEDVDYTDLDRLAEFDIIIANSDYVSNKDLEPDKEEFTAFLDKIDEEKIPIIWTGHINDRGGIRFLQRYEGNPEIDFRGNINGVKGKVIAEHPITTGIPLDSEFEFLRSNDYYYAFDGYRGTTIVDLVHDEEGRIGSMVAYGGRTIDSVEVLLGNFTFSYYYNPTLVNFDPIRERILNNAILWALDNEEALVGELYGTVTNNLGMDVYGTVTVLETGKTINTKEDGTFFLGLPTGNYTLRVEAFGHDPKEFTVEITNGIQTEQTFELTANDIGIVNGTIRDAQTGEPIENALVTALNTPLSATTDENGSYSIALPTGQYDFRVTAPGYMSQVITNILVKNNEETNVSAYLQVSEKIAVIASSSNATKLEAFLSDEGYEVDSYTTADLTPLIESLDNYSLIIFNNKQLSTTTDQFIQLIDESDEHGVSIIFTSQYGSNPIRELRYAFNDPQSDEYSYKEEHINVKVISDHPIFNGISGDEFRILTKPRASQQYAVFGEYSGTVIGQISHDDAGVLGNGIAYKFRTANSVHVLLASLQVSGSYSDPNVNWTDEAKLLYTNAINWAINASLGEIIGTVTDSEGNPISGATVSIPEMGITVATDANGQYRISTGTGIYEVEASARGYHKQVQTVEIQEQGQSVELNFTLESIAGTTISGTVKNQADQSAIPNATVTLTSLDDDSVADTLQTDENGYFLFDKLLPGKYLLTVSADGFVGTEEEVTLSEEPYETELFLSKIQIAVLGDHNEQITNLLNANDLYSASVDWSVLDTVHEYELVIVNTNQGSSEQVQELIQKADENKVSLVFLGTWGIKEGSIQLLTEALGYPEIDNQGYDQGQVILQVTDTEHPIFSGLSESIVIHSEKSPYQTFKNYPGFTLGNLEVDNEDKGTAIAYEFRSAESIHLLLSSFAVTNIIGPDYGWTEDGKKLFTNAIEFALSAQQDLPQTPVWDADFIRPGANPVTVTGTASPFDTVRIYEQTATGLTEIGITQADLDGKFSIDIELETGNYILYAKAENFSGESELSEQLRVFYFNRPGR